MNLITSAIRICLTRALRDRTYAGDRVKDSPLEPLDDLMAPKAAALPYIAVFTGDVEVTDIDGLNISLARSKVDLTIQVYSPMTVEVEVEGQKKRFSGSAVAIMIDAIGRQIAETIAAGAEPWGRMFQTLCPQVTSAGSKPFLMQIEAGARIPMREFTFTCHSIADPPWGRPLSGVWLDLDAALRSVPEHNGTAVADMLKALIVNPAGMVDWRREMMNLAVTFDQASAMGILPLDADMDDPAAAAPLSSVHVDSSVVGSTPHAVFTETPEPPGDPLP